MRWFSVCVLVFTCLCLTGCDAKDSTGIAVDLSNLNWQTAALIGLAYLANSRGHLAALASTIRAVLQSLRVLPAPESPQSLTAAEAAKLIGDLVQLLQGMPELQSQLLELQKSILLQEVTDAKE